MYEIIPQGQHCQAHEVVLIIGDRFPDWEGCRQDVRFRLLRTAPYIFHDEDFAPEG